MKKNLKISLLLLAVTVSQVAFSQNVNNSGSTLITKSEVGSKPIGSQYFNEAFIPANIEGRGLTMIKYNAYMDQIELKGPTDQVSTLDAQEGVLIETTDKRNIYEFVNYTTDENEKTKGYLNLIANNNQVKIYSRQRIYLQAETEEKSGYEGYKPPAYKKASTKYFIKTKDNPIVQFGKKKDLVKLFPGKDKEIGSFISANKISFSDEQDLKKLGEFLNTL